MALMHPGPAQERSVRAISRTRRVRLQDNKMALPDIRQGQEVFVKMPQAWIAGLLVSAAELYRGADAVALSLPLMQQERPRQRRNRQQRRFLLIITEAYRGPRLVVVFQKTHARLKWGVRGAYPGYQPVEIARQQRIIQLFVVGKVKTEVLQAQLQTPVDLGNSSRNRDSVRALPAGPRARIRVAVLRDPVCSRCG